MTRLPGWKTSSLGRNIIVMTVMPGLPRSAVTSPMLSGFTICWAMSGSGARTGIAGVIIAELMATISQGLHHPFGSGSREAVPGPTSPHTSDLLYEAGFCRIFVLIMWDSDWFIRQSGKAKVRAVKESRVR
jgi:hypothetical protein